MLMSLFLKDNKKDKNILGVSGFFTNVFAYSKYLVRMLDLDAKLYGRIA